MPNKLSNEEKRERLSELMAGFSTAMLVTRTDDGGMRARPLSIADKRDDGALYFSTAVESPKVHELQADAHVNVVMQDGRRFVSLSGIARVVQDRALVEALWTESWKIWFPKGKDDPSLCLLVVEPLEAAYWDASGTQGVRYAFEMAKAYVTGKSPPSDGDERHTGHVKL
jgi:general stress protein 26